MVLVSCVKLAREHGNGKRIKGSVANRESLVREGRGRVKRGRGERSLASISAHHGQDSQHPRQHARRQQDGDVWWTETVRWEDEKREWGMQEKGGRERKRRRQLQSEWQPRPAQERQGGGAVERCRWEWGGVAGISEMLERSAGCV